MSEIRQLAHGNVVSEPNIHSSDDELVRNSALRKELEVFVIRTVQQQVVPIIEPLIRRVVKEEIKLAQERILTSMNQNSGEMIISSQPRKLKLRFQSKLSLRILTSKPITGEDKNPVKIDLIDESTGLVVKYGPAASAKVEIVVLQVDPDGDETELTPEKFNQKIIKERKGNKSLLTGNTSLNLNEGTGSVGKISFTHGSSWMKKCEFMLGARFVDDFDGVTVTEAISERFTLEDCRNKLYEKHYPPSILDDVWRLNNIRKGGPNDKRLKEENITTVKDFLTLYFIDRQKLRKILIGMSDKMLETTVAHGLTCNFDKKYLYYAPGFELPMGIVFNVVGQLLGVISTGHFVSIDNLPERERDDAQKLLVWAFQHWGDVVPYDENSLSCSYSRLVYYDHTQPSTSSPHVSSSNIFTGASHRSAGYNHMEPCMSSPNIISANIVIGTSHSTGCDPTQPNTSTHCIIPSNTFDGTSHIDAGYNHTQPSTSSGYFVDTSRLNTRYDGIQPITAPVGVMPHSSSNTSMGRDTDARDSGVLNISDMDMELGDIESLCGLLRSPIQVPDLLFPDPESLNQDLAEHEDTFDVAEDMFDVASLIQNFEEDVQQRFPSRDRIKKCFKKMSIVLRFSLRKRNDGGDNDPKRQRIL